MLSATTTVCYYCCLIRDYYGWKREEGGKD